MPRSQRGSSKQTGDNITSLAGGNERPMFQRRESIHQCRANGKRRLYFTAHRRSSPNASVIVNALSASEKHWSSESLKLQDRSRHRRIGQWRTEQDRTAQSLYIKRSKVSVRTPHTYVRNGGCGQLSSEWRHNENDVITRTGAASAVGARRHDENEVTMTIAGLWRYSDWRHVATVAPL